MSHTTISEKVRQQIWLRAGGRCEYLGCNAPLWKDELTQAEMNRAYLAHIIADTPGGPRGDPILSAQLKTDPGNIMLLCDTHHRMIDREERDKHSVELLRKYKQAHEERIEWLTSLQEDRRTQIVLFGSNIGDRRGDVNFAQACEAVLPDRYPFDARGIRLDLAATGLNENDPNYWDLAMTHIDRGLDWYFHN